MDPTSMDPAWRCPRRAARRAPGPGGVVPGPDAVIWKDRRDDDGADPAGDAGTDGPRAGAPGRFAGLVARRPLDVHRPGRLLLRHALRDARAGCLRRDPATALPLQHR